MTFYFVSFMKIAKRTVTCKYCSRKIRKGEPYWLTAETYWYRRVRRITCYECARKLFTEEIPRQIIRQQRIPGRKEVYPNERQLKLAEELDIDLVMLLREMGYEPVLPDGWSPKNEKKTVKIEVEA